MTVATDWNKVWDNHPEVFVAHNWQECPEEKRKAWRLPSQFSFYMGGETALRVGIIASNSIPREEDFLLSGICYGQRLSNGAKTIVYFVAPDFSPPFLHVLSKISGNISVRAVYWRERLRPSLYLIPEGNMHASVIREQLGEERPDWNKWARTLNPVARQQLAVVKDYFTSLGSRRIRADIRSQHISLVWGNTEIAEVRRKGKKFELNTKTRWERSQELANSWQKAGWVNVDDSIDPEFCHAIEEMLAYLERMEREGGLRQRDRLALILRSGTGVIQTQWGSPWTWPWMARDRGESWISDLGQWYYFEQEDRLNVICPIWERPLAEAGKSILLTSVLERSRLLWTAKGAKGQKLNWDGRVHWLTLPSLVEELKRWHCWLKQPMQFPIWSAREDWENTGFEEVAIANGEDGNQAVDLSMIF